ncbi:MAG: hypothetical protein JO051_14320 [Acidobacteriaceae bacterium]|nr:hypothetical protein [Acidobacteriaceae bacterium]
MTRRQWLAGGALLVSSACRSRKGSGFAGYALISNAGDRSLAAVDLTQFRLTRSIPLGAAASETILCPGGECLVLTPSTGSIHVIDRQLRVAKSRKLSDNLSAMCLSPDGKTVIATAGSARELIVADASSLAIRARYKMEAEPVSLAVPPAPRSGEGARPRYVAVSTGAHGTVELIDYATGQRWRKDLGSVLGAVTFRADGERLLVADLHERCIGALSTPALQTIADLPLAMAPDHLCFNADQGQLFVSGEGMDAVAIIFPYNPLDVDQTVLAGRDPGVMACSENPAYLFVGSEKGSDVCILNVDSRKMIGIVDAGQRPTYITVTPDSRYALILSEGAGTMAVIHISEVQANASNADKWRNKMTAGLFTLLPVGNRPVHAAVMPRFV